MGEGINRVNEKINSFKKRYYLNLLIRGSIFTASVILTYFIIASLVEYNLWLGRGARFLIFTSFFVLVGLSIFHFLKEPLAWWIYRKGMGEEESAKLIGRFFPSVGDKLLNVIQLAASHQRSELLNAGISQKTISFKDIAFESAIDIKENKRYLKYFVIPFLLILVLWIVNQGIFTQSATRIVKFNQEFSPQAPFQFVLHNKSLQSFFNEDFTLKIELKGDAIPLAAYIVSGEQRWKMESEKTGFFSYTFEKMQNEISLQIDASGFLSDVYSIELVNRPELTQLKASLEFPRYLNRKPEQLTNAGNLEIPEGTKVTWQIAASNTTKAIILFSSEESQNLMQLFDNESFKYSKDFNNPEQYTILLENERSKNKDQISYTIEVMKDQFPQIIVENLRDSILYSTIYLGGSISDDYGLTNLRLNYQIVKRNKELPVTQINIPIAANQAQQNFFFRWVLDSLKLEPGDKLSYHFQVWDNDGVNGRKSSRSTNYTFSLPDKEELKEQIGKSEQSAENRIDQSLQKAKDLRQSIEEAQQKLRGKQTLDWQDKKMLEDLIKQRQKLDEAINTLQKENELLEKKKENFSEESERIKEKSEQIQTLMNELLDDETRKMFQELEKLLKENADANQIQKMLDKMDRKEINLEKELERTLELFKQLKYEYKAEQAVNELEKQIEKQEELLSKTEDLSSEDKKEKSNKKDEKETAINNEKEKSQELAGEQEELQKEFDELEKSLEELDKLGEELNKQESTPSEDDKQEVKDAQEKSKQELQKSSPKKSQEQQKKSISKMKEMKEQMESMQNSMEMEIDMQNLESLRQILHGLIKLSFDQESLMKEFGGVQQTDPKYINLSQNQLKLKDDAKILEDSLLSLAKKDAFMGSVVTREVGELNGHIDKAVDNIKERRKAVASSEMQFSMTSMNNLALMLNDHYNMMMDMMANAQPGMGKKKKGQTQPSLGKMQQMLNQQMEEIKKSGKTGRQLSEEMARMAAEQERIRRALQEMQEKLKENGGQMPGGDLPGKMEQTEFDLVNKQITEQTIKRQKEILTRLLDAEKSMREQDMDEERKGETAKDYGKEMPREFEEYLKLKEKEVELLKTVPPKLYPYYKKEVNDYFKRIGTEE
jgi:hypothetical protein